MNTGEPAQNSTENSTDTEVIKALTIKKPLKTDVDLFRKLTSGCANQGEAFGKLVDLAKTATENTGKPSEELETLRSVLENSNEIIKELEAQVQALTDQLAEKPTEVTVEKPVPIPLKGTQFICEPSIEVASIARKYRPFLIKKGLASTSNYLNDLVNTSVSYFIKEKF